jgi:hypothetical protein
MANRKTFSDFDTKLNPKPTDYVVGYDHSGRGGEKRYPFSQLKNYIKKSDIVEITTDITLPVNLSSTDSESGPPIPNLNGKIFHVIPDPQEDIEITLPQLSPDERVRFEVVNLMDSHKVKILTNIGSFKAKGDILGRKFHTATIYFDGTSWHGFGDLVDISGGALKIREVSENYTFVRDDTDTILHFVVSNPTKVTLPDPSALLPGTQFYITNLSEQIITLVTEDSELRAKATKLRRQYDDAVVYTDGKNWFATGDLL